ncbi:hypothetical protein ACFQQB_67180 [Nonomuraea rubra]|uniref:hypothetical protein n=1 Tax=Nonomuraea rubra TaxID=46180 RepID=UPI0036081B35
MVPPTSDSLTVTFGLSWWYLSAIALAAGSLPFRLQVQNSSVTGPLALAFSDGVSPEEQAASDADRAIARAAPSSVRRRCPPVGAGWESVRSWTGSSARWCVPRRDAGFVRWDLT